MANVKQIEVNFHCAVCSGILETSLLCLLYCARLCALNGRQHVLDMSVKLNRRTKRFVDGDHRAVFCTTI